MAIPTDVDGTWVNLNTVQLDAGELRRADATLFAGDGSTFGVTGGVVRHGDSSLSVSVDGSDVVTIQPGPVVIPGNAVAGTGCYRFALGTAITGALSARNATNPRIDLIVARFMDTDVVGTHGAYTGRFQIVAGTPGSVPAVPALPSMAVELGRITVPNTGGGAASVDLTHRTYASAIGGELVVPTYSMLPASAAKYQRARALDTGLEHVWDGSEWHGDWRTLTLNSGWTGSVRYRRVGQTVRLSGSVAHATAPAGQWNTPCSLPTKYRPASTELFGLGGNTSTVIQGQVLSTGEVQMWTSAVTTAARGVGSIRFDLG